MLKYYSSCFTVFTQPIGRAVYQIDLVPTLSLLLGVPIPYSNLGMIIPELFLPFKHSTSSAHYDSGYSGRVTSDLLTALRINANQIRKYLSSYVQYSNDIPEQAYHDLAQRIDHILNNNYDVEGMAQSELTKLADGYVHYMKDVKEMCHRVWAKFDDGPILYGLVLTLMSVLLTPVILLNADKAVSSLRGSLHYAALISLVMTGITSSWDMSVLWTTINFVYWTMSTATLAMLWNMRSMMSSLHHHSSLILVLTVTMVTLYAISLLSNSYVLYEGDMVAFFLQTLLVYYTFSTLRVKLSATTQGLLVTVVKATSPCVVFMVCIRLSKVFYSCRDLQFQDGCQEFTFINSLLTASDVLGWLGKWRLLLSCVAVVMTPVLIARVIGGNIMSKYLNPWTLNQMRIGLPLSGVCVSVYWALQLLPTSVINGLSYWEHVTLPWMVYAISVIMILTIEWRPLTLPSTHLTMTDTNTLNQQRPPTKEPSSKEPSTKEPSTKEPSSKEPSTVTNKMRGVERIIGMVIIILMTSVWVPLSLLLNDGLALSAALVALQIALAVGILSRVEIGMFDSLELSCCLVCLYSTHFVLSIATGGSLHACVFWGLLTCHTFFTFGHSTTVTSLRFECAFIGIHGEVNSYNLPLAGALVGLNTLGSQVWPVRKTQ